VGKRITGKMDRHERGFGFLIPDDPHLEDVFIPPGRLKGAMTDDRIEVEVQKEETGEKNVGHVVAILERGIEKLIGTVKISPEKSVVIPDSVRLGEPVRVPDQFDNTRVEDGELVEVEIESYHPLEGIIIDVLGEPGDPEVEEKVLLKKYDLKMEFPESVVEEAEALPEEVPQEALEGRRGLDDLTIVTIDPFDAKDLDDAVSVQPLEDGKHRVGVHITDVSHFVEEGGALDEEARERATSTYLADKVVPMFPTEFSNGIGSLDQDVNRLTISVFMTVDRQGKVTDAEFCKSYINVDQRLSYGEVDEYLNNDDYSGDVDEVSDTIDRMIDVSQRIRQQRMDRGSLDFDLPEVSLKCQEGEVEDIIHVEHTKSHQAIEEFMIAANEAVARHLTDRNIPTMYRIHEPPAHEDVDEFAQFVNGLGYNLETEGDVHPSSFQRILEQSRDRPEEKVIAWNMLRSMQKARYSPDNMGHFGLASNCYLHFTSPIRRYPDLTVHRALKTVIERGDMDSGHKHALKEELPELSTHTSEREENATEAERESKKVKLLQYMEDKVGEEYEGYVSSVLSFGCFVQLPNTLEGLVHVSTLDDYYVFSEEDYSLIGERSGNVIHIGDRVRVQVSRVDIPSRELDFELLEIVESELGDRYE
jgi:ribonuclease R